MSDFYGLSVDAIGDDHLTVEYLTTVGPRIVGLHFNGQNILAQTPDIKWDTPNGVFHLRGGHRLWVAPETKKITYAPDDSPPVIKKINKNEVLITGDIDTFSQVQKSISIKMLPERNTVNVSHTITNFGEKNIKLAPWGITQLRLGGFAVFPSPKEPVDPESLLPNRNLVLWPYADFNDHRMKIEGDFYIITAKPDSQPFKFGYLNIYGWMAYAWNDILFCKQISYKRDAVFPDMGCNTEAYIHNQFIELETLGPLTDLNPGQSTLHLEVWRMFQLNDTIESLEHVRAVLPSLHRMLSAES